MGARLFRVQDAEGRGPYRPGFSSQWSSPVGPVYPPWWKELGLPMATAIGMIPRGMHGGSAFQSIEQLTAWFMPEEREKLNGFGYVVVKFRPDMIVAETPTQVVFAQHSPLAGLPVMGRLPVPEDA